MIRRLLIFALFLASCMSLTGCTSVQTINDLSYSLIDIQKGISAIVPKGVGKISENRRTFYSKYFDPESVDADRSLERADDVFRERATVIVTVLGDRRPYTVEVEVLIKKTTLAQKQKKKTTLLTASFL